MNEIIISYIRTIVPSAVGVLVAWLATRGVQLDQTTTAGLIAFLTGAASTLYYICVRLLEQYASPRFGWLLGYAKMPTYTVKPQA